MAKHEDVTFEELKSIYTKVPRLGAEIVIKDEMGRILLTLRTIAPYKGKWHLPGGTIYADESVTDAVQRIAKSELGVEVSIDNFLGYKDYVDYSKQNGFGHTVGLYFLCKPKTSKIILDFQASDYKYFKQLPSNIIKEQWEFLATL